MDCSAVVLNKLLQEQDLEIWAKLKLVFLDAAYTGLYSAIKKYYDKYSALPTFSELEIGLREGPALKTLAAVRLADAPDVSGEVALDALIDQYTQSETIVLLDKFLDKLPQFDTHEIKENLSTIVLTLDDKTLASETVYTMSDLMIFKSEETINRERVYLNLNNQFDAILGGANLQELILIGGYRGSGKSITCSNIQTSQYLQGNVCPYFTIEMIGQEVMDRNLAILADVNLLNIKNNKCTPEEIVRLAKVRAEMFVNGKEIYEDFLKHRDRFQFESTLVRECQLKPDNQMIIIDDRVLSINSIDLHLGKLKAKFGSKLKVGVVDYLNQIAVESKGQFDWQPQIEVSKQLKNLARKHDMILFSPYQIDASGEARFAKGILDAADIAFKLKVRDKASGDLIIEVGKIRGGPEMTCISGINWDTLKIDPTPREAAPEEPEDKPKKKNNKNTVKSDEAANDRPPWD